MRPAEPSRAGTNLAVAMIESGQPVPQTHLVDRGSKRQALHDLIDRPTLLVVFKPSCPTCRMGLPVYDHWRRYEPAVRVLAVSQDTVDATDVLFSELDLGLDTLYDRPPYEMSNAFGVSAVPSLFLIENGQVTWTGHGWSRADAEEVEERLAVLAGREPALLGAGDLPMLKPG